MSLSRARPGWLCAAALCAILLFVTVAQAQRVILVCPPEADASLNEAFNRLRGELTMHGFEVEIKTVEESISVENLAQSAESVKAVASVSFVRNEGFTTADIKISDRVTGKTTIRTIATPIGTDAASLLALRAVELLRASLREFGPKAEASKDIVGASPQRSNVALAQWAQAPMPPGAQQYQRPGELTTIRRPITLRADLAAAAFFPHATTAYGFGAALGVPLDNRFEMRLVLAAPWFGAKYAASQATSQLHLISGFGELSYSIRVRNRVDLQPLAAIGMARVTTYTSTIIPWVPLTPSALLAIPSIGLGLKVTLSTRVFWYTSGRVAVLLPRTVLHVENEQFTLGLPLVMVSSGVGFAF